VLGRPRLSTRCEPVYRNRMTDPEKQARLAEALRANLRRRKAQSRAIAAEGEREPDAQIIAASQKAVDPAT
jgi:hypothetical protein